jgi:hypothetical protein
MLVLSLVLEAVNQAPLPNISIQPQITLPLIHRKKLYRLLP